MTTKLKTLVGWVSVDEAHSGIELASVDRTPSFVTGILQPILSKIYRITFSDGRSIESSATHLLKVHLVHEYKEGYGNEIHNGSHQNTHRKVFVPLVSGDFGSDTILPSRFLVIGRVDRRRRAYKRHADNRLSRPVCCRESAREDPDFWTDSESLSLAKADIATVGA